MKKTTILSMSECVLLNRSDQIKNDEDYTFLLPFLEKEKKVMIDEMIGKGISERKIDNFVKNKGDIISLSSGEWARRKVNPTVHKPGKCEFCGQPLEYRYYVINGRNKEEMYVGGDCVNYFSSDALLTHQSAIKELKQLKNKEYLENNYIELVKEFNDRDFLYKQETIVLEEYEEKYIKIKKDFRKKYNSIIKKRTQEKIEKLCDIYSDLQKIKEEIIESCLDISTNEFVVNKEFYNYLRNDERFDLVIETAMKTGSPAPATIHNVKFKPFLQEFENKFNSLYKGNLSIRFINEDSVIFRILLMNQKITLNMKTEVILEWFNKTIIGKKYDDFCTKISLFAKKVENPKDVVNDKELYNYFLKELRLVKIDKSKVYSKLKPYNEFVFNYFNNKTIYNKEGQPQVYVLDDIEILRSSIILLVQNKIKTLPTKHPQQKIEYKEYNSIEELKEKLRETYEIRQSFS